MLHIILALKELFGKKVGGDANGDGDGEGDGKDGCIGCPMACLAITFVGGGIAALLHFVGAF